jgi:hypothetical protein
VLNVSHSFDRVPRPEGRGCRDGGSRALSLPPAVNYQANNFSDAPAVFYGAQTTYAVIRERVLVACQPVGEVVVLPPTGNEADAVPPVHPPPVATSPAGQLAVDVLPAVPVSTTDPTTPEAPCLPCEP